VVVSHPLFKRYRVPSESMLPTIGHVEKVNLNGGVARGSWPAPAMVSP
jgi:hypothetical protein